MNASEVNIDDIVKITDGNWKFQKGRVTHKVTLVSSPEEPEKALLTISMLGFGFSIQKVTTGVEKSSAMR